MSMRQGTLAVYRRRLVSVAEGRVLEIGVGSGLNLPHYGEKAERIIGLDPSAKLLSMAERATKGVLIPAANLKNLMLHQDVVDAVSRGEFHIYPVETIDEGIELLTGSEAGQRGEDGDYAYGTVNHRVQRRLNEMAKRQIELAQAMLKGIHD
jgi:hypothetical protein